MIVTITKLKRGQRFSFIPPAWHGPSVVLSNEKSGSDCVKLTFDNKKIINPPGIQYCLKTEKVRLLKDKK